MKKLLKTIAGMAGFSVIRTGNGYAEDGLATIHSDAFRHEPDFRAAYARGLKSLLAVTANPRNREIYEGWQGEFVPNVFGQWRTHIALWCARNAARRQGDFVECGVFVGFQSSAIMTALDWDSLGKQFYLIDTFTGPETAQLNEEEIRSGRREEIERLRGMGGYRYDFKTVQGNFAEWKNVRLIQGTVPEILSSCPAEKVSYLHIDMNCVYPEIEAFRFFWDKLVPGALVLLDDYTFKGLEPQHAAFDRLAQELDFHIASLPTGQGLILKS